MTLEELKLRRLAGQHLLAPADPQTVVKDLCGVQAQLLSHALHALSIRCDEVRTEGLVKSWTNRGTMHLFSADDLPLFLHEGRTHFLRPVDTLESDEYISAERKAYFADMIVDAVAKGIDEREALKSVCEKAGMTEGESKSLFDPWGGTTVGWWNLKNRRLKITLFSPADQTLLSDAAGKQWNDLKQIEFL